MSKNFELLLRAEEEHQLFSGAGKSYGNGRRGRPDRDLDVLAREEQTKLVQRLFLLSRPEAPRAVVFAGVERGAGCSWVCCHAAEALAAQLAGSVCLVDGNLRAPSLHQHFGVDKYYGLTDAMIKSDPIRNFTQRLAGGNLWLLPCGSPTGDLRATLTSDRLRARVQELHAEFDHILIDAPPVGQYADAVQLGQLADGLILVLESNATRRETARKAKEIVETAQVRLLGAVLNKRSFPIPEALYWKL